MATMQQPLAVPSKERLSDAFTAVLDLEEFHIEPIVNRLAKYLEAQDEERQRLSTDDVVQITAFLAEGREYLRNMAAVLDYILGRADLLRDIAEGAEEIFVDDWNGYVGLMRRI